MLKWVTADEDTDQESSFKLEANGSDLSQLEYLAPNFKLVGTDPEFFDAVVTLDDEEVHTGSFEWRAATLSHKIAEKIQDKQVKKVQVTKIRHSSVVTSECLSVISKLRKPDSGFEKLELEFIKLDEPVSETVLNQFVQHIKHLQDL